MSEIPSSPMNLGKPAVLDIATVVVSPEGGDDSSFSAVFHGQMDAVEVAEGGNDLPKGGDIELQSRQLKGGTKIKVSGQEPSDEGLTEFALSQGMDPRALLMLRDSEQTTVSIAVVDRASVAAADGSIAATGSAIDSAKASAIAAQITQAAFPGGHDGPSGMVDAAMEAHALIDLVNRAPTPSHGACEDFGPQLRIEPSIVPETAAEETINSSAVGAMPTPAHVVFAAGDVGRAAQKFDSVLLTPAPLDLAKAKVGHQIHTGAQPDGDPAQTLTSNKLASKELTNVSGKGSAVNLATLGVEKVTPQPFKGVVDGLAVNGEKRASQWLGDNARGFVQMDDSPNQGSRPLVQTGGSRAADITPLNHSVEQGSAKPTVTEQVVTAAQTRLQERHMAGKMVLPKVEEAAVKRLIANRQQTASVKMAPINLVPALAEQASIMLGTPSTATSAAAFVAGQAADYGSAVTLQGAQTVVTSALGDTAQDDPARETLRRQNEQDQLSQRLSQVLGQRLSAQIERGSWRVEMDLHPASMGRVEVQLEMRNGDLEANFISSNAATRELLNDSMPRLREMFEQLGMNSAYLGLGSSNQGRSDGNSASEHSGSQSADDGDDKSIAHTAARKPVSDDGLDVLV